MSIRRIGTGRGITPSRLTGVAVTFNSYVMALGPAAYWRLGEGSGTTLVDSSGNGKNGTWSGTVTWTTSLLTNDADQCVDFNGTNTQADTPTFAGALEGDYITVMALINLDANNKQQVIFARADESGTNNVAFKFYVTSANKLAFRIRNNSSADYTATGATSLSTGTRYMCIGRFDGSTVKVYLNGVEDGSTAASGTMRKAGATLGGLMGAGYNGSIVDRFDGKMDEVVQIASAISTSVPADLQTLV